MKAEGGRLIYGRWAPMKQRNEVVGNVAGGIYRVTHQNGIYKPLVDLVPTVPAAGVPPL